VRRLLILPLVFLILLASTSIGADEGETQEVDDASLARFRLVPPDAAQTGALAPLVVVLPSGEASSRSGSGGRSAFEVLTSATVRRRHPAYILSPRSAIPDNEASGGLVDPRAFESALDTIMRDFPIDADRVYIIGEYAGADAAWRLLHDLRGVFAAGVALGGVIDPEVASTINDVALWVFHGENDERVPVGRVRSMIGAMWSAGAIDVRYTEVRDSSQDVRSTAWAESRLLPWLFSQSRE